MTGSPSREWSYGWPIVVAGALGMTMMGLHTAAIGTMIKPLSDAFGWSRLEISAGMTLNTVLLFIGMPIVALILPRFGARRIVICAGLMFSIGFVVLGLATSQIWTWYLGWSIMGLAQSGISALIWTTVIARTFDKARGFALAVALSGSGLATFAVPLITAYSLRIGLFAPFMVLAAITALLFLPLIVLFMRMRPEFNSQPKMAAVSARTKAGDSGELRELLRHRQVWQLVVISALTSTAIGLLFAHLQAIILDVGASATEAAAYFAVIGPTMIFGRLCTGLLLDRMPTRPLAAMLILLPAISCLILLGYNGSPALGVLACVVFGLGLGAELDLLAYICAKYFGTRHYPVVYSIVYGIYALGAGVGAMIGGATYDSFGSYEPILVILVGAVAVSAVLVLMLGKERGSIAEESDPQSNPTATAPEVVRTD